MTVLPILLGLLLAFCFGTSDYLSKGVTGRIGGYRTAVWTLSLSGIGVLFPALVLQSKFEVNPLMFLALIFIAATTFLAFNFMYRAYNSGALSLTSPVVNSYPIVSVLFSVFVLDVSLPILAIVALAIAIVGIMLVSTSFSEVRNSTRLKKITPGLRYALLAALFFGVTFPAFGYASENLGYLLPAISTRAAAAGIGFLASRSLKEDAYKIMDIPWRRLLAMAALESGGVASFSIGVIFSSYSGAIPILSTFGGMSVVFTVTYAIILLRERLEINHIVGIVMVIVGVATLLYLTG